MRERERPARNKGSKKDCCQPLCLFHIAHACRQKKEGREGNGETQLNGRGEADREVKGCRAEQSGAEL